VGKKVIISVISDLVTDQRVNRSATALQEEGWDVLLVGRRKPDSPDMDDRTYAVTRFRLWFNKGPLFYINYNIRLFFFLLMNSFDVAFSNDLDTLPANFIASRIKNKTLVYDSHEYFTGVPELSERKFTRNIWRFLEKLFVPRTSYLFTVNESIAALYKAEYHVDFKVLRNVPLIQPVEILSKEDYRKKLQLPGNKFIYILQGSGINIQRGAEEAVEAMQHVDGLLLIVGSGDVVDILKQNVKALLLEDKVIFKGRMSYREMMEYTRAADAGLTLDKDTNVNYRYSLPNKLFDYIHAGIPVLASSLTEIKKIVEGYQIGLITDTHQPLRLAEWMNKMKDPAAGVQWKINLQRAAAELNWQNEKKVLTDTFQKL
jgi:glycosyltransferase involved in cell wall biosynthesis